MCEWQLIDYLVTVKSRWLSDLFVKVRSFNNDYQIQMCAINWLVDESLLPLYQPNPGQDKQLVSNKESQKWSNLAKKSQWKEYLCYVYTYIYIYIYIYIWIECDEGKVKAEFHDVSLSVLCGECGLTLCSHFPVKSSRRGACRCVGWEESISSSHLHVIHH